MKVVPVKTKFNEDLLAGFRRHSTGRVVLLHSGGADSTASGLLLRAAGLEVHPLFVDYGQASAEAERHAAAASAQALGLQPCSFLVTDLLTQLSSSPMLHCGADDDAQAWVPARNTILMVLASIYAAQLDADGICIGYMIDDNFVFGDNDYFHHKTMEILMSHSLARPISVFMPAYQMTKRDIIDRLRHEGVLQLTTSCWNAKLVDGKLVACHACANCVERDQYDREGNGTQ